MVWFFVDVLGRRLLAWGLLSVALGAALTLPGDAGWRGFGAMALAWGAVDALLGVAARVIGERTRRRTIGDPAARDRAARRLRPILLVNAGLDIGYVALGAWLAASADGDAWRGGAGLGIVVQGAFLLAFDLVHTAWAPHPGPLVPEGMAPFAGLGHEPFRLSRVDQPGEGGTPADTDPVRGALLVHGFAGSPRELRGLAAVLAARGWLVEVPRLPGHGTAFADIAEYRVEDWIAEVEAGAEALRASGVTRLVVAGHSVGGSLALATAARLQPDALVLLAPFCWPVPRWQRLVAPLLRVVLPPGFRVFSRMDLDDPSVRAGVGSLMPGADLGDPATVAQLRDLQVPVTLLEQLFRVAAMAAEAAPTIRVPVLAIQGTEDAVSRPDRTRSLLATLPAPPSYLEVDAGHDLVTEASPVRDGVLTAVLAFATEVTRPGPFEAAARSGGPPH